MNKLIDKIIDALLKPVNEIVTALIGIYTIIWGIWVADPFMDTFSSSLVYSNLIQFIPFEWVWGVIAIFFGAFTIWGLMSRRKKRIFHGAAASGIHWFVLSIFYFAGSVANTAGITALFFAILSAYLYLNYKFQDEDDKILRYERL